MMPKPSTFAFGANWNRFLRHVTEDRVRRAEGSLTEFMDLENLRDRSFLDIGCGKGSTRVCFLNLLSVGPPTPD